MEWTLVVAGPIISRSSEGELEETFGKLSSLVESSGLKVIFSTYPNEVPSKSERYPFRFVTLNDPGPDTFDERFKMKAWERNRNSSRVLASTRFGLSHVKTEFAIKSRIELLPVDSEFIAGLGKIQNIMEESAEIKISTLGPHYIGTQNNYKDAYLWIPDMIQFMRSVDMLRLWQKAEKYWLEYKELWMQRPSNAIATEQVLGLAYANLFGTGYPLSEFHDFSRITLNRHVYRNICKWERSQIFTMKVTDLGLPRNRFTSIELAQKHVDLPLNAKIKFPSYFKFKIAHLRKVAWINRIRIRYPVLTFHFWKSFFLH